MYDLLNTQACLSREKEHLRLPERHLVHPGAWLFRALCVKKYWARVALTETLPSWGGSEHCGRCSAFNSSGICGPNIGWCQSLPGNLKKNGFTFPMLSRSSFNALLCPCCCLAVCCGGKTEPDKKSPTSPSVLRAPAAVSSGRWCAVIFCVLPASPSLVHHELLLISPTACVSVPCTIMTDAYQEGGLVMDNPDLGGFLTKTWQTKTADPWAVPAQSYVPLYVYTVLSFTACNAGLYTHFIWTCNSTRERDKIMLWCTW